MAYLESKFLYRYFSSAKLGFLPCKREEQRRARGGEPSCQKRAPKARALLAMDLGIDETLGANDSSDELYKQEGAKRALQG